MNEQCILCGVDATVRVSGTSFCASCGIDQFSAINSVRPRSPARRRGAWFTLLTSSLLLKTMLGAVAVAAVGGAAATVLQPIAGAPAESTAAAVTTVAPTAIPPATIPAATSVAVASSGQGQEPDDSASAPDQDVEGFVAATKSWATCVSDAAVAHSGGRFDPQEACGDHPSPADFGIGNSEDAPGHDEDGPGNSEDAPGHDEDGPGNSEDAPGQAKKEK